MLEKNTLLRATLISIVILAVLEFLRPTIMTIDIAGMPDWEIQTVTVLQYVFTVTPIALLAGFAWSFFGFLRYKFGDETIKYEADKMYQTWAWYEGLLIIISAGLPMPLSLAISGIIMAVKSVLNTLRNPAPLPTEAPAIPTTTEQAGSPGPPATA